MFPDTGLVFSLYLHPVSMNVFPGLHKAIAVMAVNMALVTQLALAEVFYIILLPAGTPEVCSTLVLEEVAFKPGQSDGWVMFERGK